MIGYCGTGFKIYNDCNINKKNYSNLGCNGYFELPEGIEADSYEANSYLAGSF